ncbi:MAG: outer membrane lipoprotein carrier protein LolA [Rhodospirillales bacterium]|nr:outer membrane lipoprotein carrier protein LolA [Rhodospirillales bacterium]
MKDAVIRRLRCRGLYRLWRALMIWSAMAFTLAVGNVSAAISPQLQLDEEARSQLQRIEASLNSIHTVRSRFRQSSSNGESAQGELFLERPGRLRVEYKPPVPVLVVADGTFLIYYDRKLEQVSYIPLASTPAGILLQKHISLTDKDLVVTTFERDDGTIRIGLARTGGENEGSIRLVFDEQTGALQQWLITDAQGIITLVTLDAPVFNAGIAPALFVFKDPRVDNRGLPSGNSP